MSLAVYLQQTRVGTIEPGTGTDYTFAYAPEIVAVASPGAIVLSQSLPIREDAFDPASTRCYFEGLLPEGARREEVARELRISPNDSYRLLSEIGRDCAGAVVIVPEDEPFVEEEGAVEWLDEDQLLQLIDELPRRPLGISRTGKKVRLSLAGVQRKLALVRDDDGRFGLPSGSVPSTYLLKPEYGDEYPDLADNEAFCLAIARELGLPTAATALIEIGGRRCLLSRRFDRHLVNGTIARLHQEDLCQALGIPSNLKYESDSGPGFRLFRSLLGEIGRTVDVREMVRAAVLNFVLGNSDAHGKNFAILFTPQGRRLAPLYDLVSTAVYLPEEDEMAMAIGANFDPETVVLEDWLDMSADCDLPPSRFFALVRETAVEVRNVVRTVVERGGEEGGPAPIVEQVVSVSERRMAKIASEIDPR